MKPVKEVKGRFAYEPQVGVRSMIYCEDKQIWTSMVVGILNATDECVEIETLNTIYKVTLTDKKEFSVAA